MNSYTSHFRTLLSLLLVVSLAALLPAEEKDADKADKKDHAKKSHEVKLARGAFTLKAPGEWKKVKPRVRIIEHEFSIPAAEGDERAGRMTIMGAGGSIEANIKRWFGQFSQPDGGSTEERADVEEKTIAGQKVHIVDVAGTYNDKRGPFAPGVKRPKYRMLAAIVETKGKGNYFLKFYGPQKTVAANEKAFEAMVNSLKLEE